MKRYSTREYESALCAKGFSLARQSKDKIYYFYAEGKKQPIHTKISHGPSAAMGPKLLNYCKKQLGLNSNQELADFIGCPLGYESYVQLLKKNKHI